jgi:hypothetical protein
MNRQGSVIAQALAYPAVSITDIKVDYSHNLKLPQSVSPEYYR